MSRIQAALLIVFFANLILVFPQSSIAQTCMTRAQVSQDTRCLYILNTQVHEKGTRAKPHHGHPCGMDITSIIPSFHTNDVGRYLTSSYRTTLCSTAPPTATPTTQPTARPTNLPTSTPIPPTNPINSPTITPIPTIFFPSATPTRPPNSTPSVTTVPPITTTPSPSAQPQSPTPTSTTPQPTQALCTKMSQGDATCDDSVDLLDYVCWISIYNHSMTPGISNCVTGDFDSSGQTNSSDFMIWLTTYLSTII